MGGTQNFPTTWKLNIVTRIDGLEKETPLLYVSYSNCLTCLLDFRVVCVCTIMNGKYNNKLFLGRFFRVHQMDLSSANLFDDLH